MPLTSSGINYEHWEVGNSTSDDHNHPPVHHLTLINGFARSMSDFRAFARKLQREANIAIIMIDNRTTGATTAATPFTLNTLADDVLEVWDNLGIKSAAVLGISMGGAIALTLALTHRQRVEKLILVSSFTHHTHKHDDEFEQVRARIINSVSPGFYAKNRQLIHTLADKTAKQICTGVHRPQTQALQDYDVRDKLTDICCPTLIIHGDADRIVPRQEAEALAAGIADAKLVVFEAAGHMLLMERHGELLAEVVSFVRAKSC